MVIFIFIQILTEHFVRNRGDTDQMQQNVAFDLGLHCLSMTNKMDARLIWVKSIQKF